MLSRGFRLPSPDFCPLEISSLMQRCFLENPNDRPSFKEIKTYVEYGFNVLVNEVHSNKNKNTHRECNTQYAKIVPITDMLDETMKEQYTKMKRENQNHNNQKSRAPLTEQSVVTDETLANVSLRNQAGRYISLEDVISSGPQTDLSASCLARTGLPFGCPDRRAAQLSPASTEYKRFYSYSERTIEQSNPIYQNMEIARSETAVHDELRGFKSPNPNQSRTETQFIQLHELSHSIKSGKKKEVIRNAIQ